MTDRLTLSAYGHTVELNGPAELLTAVHAQLPATFRATDSVAEAGWSIDEAPPGQVLSELELWVAEHAEGFIFVHAGCVAVEGLAIVLPGSTMFGKSALTAALIRAGAEYLSDEYAVIGTDGNAHPYARPLSLRSATDQPPQRVAASDLGATVAGGPVPVGLVATLRYDSDASGLRVERVGRGQAILDVLANTVPAQSRPRESLAAAEAVTANSLNLHGLRGDADVAAAELLTLLADTDRDTAA